MNRPGTRRSTSRRAAWTVVLVLVAALLLPAAALGLGGTPSATAEQDQSTSQQSDSPWIRVDTAPESITPDTSATLTISVVAGKTTIPAGWQVLLTMHPRLLSSRDSVANWAGESLEGSVGAEVARVSVTQPIQPGQSRQLQVTVPANPLGLVASRQQWGPRAIALVLVDDTIDKRQAITRSFLVWNPGFDLPEPPRIGVLLPITSDDLDPTTGLASRAQLAETNPGGRLDRLLSLSTHPGVSTALDPSVLTAVPLEGTATADDTALQQWRTRVRTAATQHDYAGLGYGDTDVLALTLAGQRDLAKLADQLASDTLTDAGVNLRRDLALPAAGLADQRTVDTYVGLGRTAGLVLDENVDPTQKTQRTTPDARSELTRHGRTLPVVTVDDELSDALAATADADASGGANALQRLRADTATLAREAPGRARQILVAAPATWHPNDASQAGVGLLTSGPWTVASSLKTILTSEATTVRSYPRLTSDQRRQALASAGVGQVARSLRDTSALLTALDDPVVPLTEARRGAVGLVSVRYRDDDERWSANRQAYDAVGQQIRTGVTVVAGSTVTQVSRNVRLPVTVQNDTDNVVKVLLNVRPTSNRLVVTRQVEVTVPGHSRAVGYVPVRGNGNGDTSVRIGLLTPGGIELGEEIVTRVQVRADWESVGTTAIGIVAALLVALGLARAIRRGTRIARAGRDPLTRHDPATPSSGGDQSGVTS